MPRHSWSGSSKPTKGLSKMFPGKVLPFICNAPTDGATDATFAVAVHQAGGLGFIAGGEDLVWDSNRCKNLRRELDTVREMLGLRSAETPTPVGIGCLTMNCEEWTMDLIRLVETYKPVAVWLFANARREQHSQLIRQLKQAGRSWDIRTIVQVGNVASARDALEDGADVLVAQGSDAGGHQLVHGASLMTLLPEVRDLLDQEYRHVPLLAAGGIMDRRSVGAALLLGADGVVLGTRLLCAKECPLPIEIKQRLIDASDGACAAPRSTTHDTIIGDKGVFPPQYLGRALAGEHYRSLASGVDEDSVVRSYEESQLGDHWYQSRVVWTGAGVG